MICGFVGNGNSPCTFLPKNWSNWLPINTMASCNEKVVGNSVRPMIE